MGKSTLNRSRHKGQPVTTEWIECNVVKDPDTGCWNWMGRLDNGYAHARVDGKNNPLHRLSFQLWHKTTIPEGMLVCHRCDNRKCVNPNHLFIGTHTDNVRDCMQKNRQVWSYGEKNGMARLTNVQVAEIRIATGTHQSIADRYKTARSNVTLIKSGKHRKPPPDDHAHKVS